MSEQANGHVALTEGQHLPFPRSPARGTFSSDGCLPPASCPRPARAGHPSPAEDASLIRHHIIWRNWNSHDQAVRELVEGTNAPDTAIGGSHQVCPAAEAVAGVTARRVE